MMPCRIKRHNQMANIQNLANDMAVLSHLSENSGVNDIFTMGCFPLEVSDCEKILDEEIEQRPAICNLNHLIITGPLSVPQVLYYMYHTFHEELYLIWSRNKG